MSHSGELSSHLVYDSPLAEVKEGMTCIRELFFGSQDLQKSVTYLPRLNLECFYKKSRWAKHVHELWPPTCKPHTVWWSWSGKAEDQTVFQPHCRFCFDSITVAVRIFWDSLHFLFIAPHASGPTIWLAFLSCQARLAIVVALQDF